MFSKTTNKHFLSQATRLAQAAPMLANSVPRRAYQPVLNSLSKNVISAEYAVRGQIPIRGEQIMKII